MADYEPTKSTESYEPVPPAVRSCHAQLPRHQCLIIVERHVQSVETCRRCWQLLLGPIGLPNNAYGCIGKVPRVSDEE